MLDIPFVTISYGHQCTELLTISGWVFGRFGRYFFSEGGDEAVLNILWARYQKAVDKVQCQILFRETPRGSLTSK